MPPKKRSVTPTKRQPKKPKQAAPDDSDDEEYVYESESDDDVYDGAAAPAAIKHRIAKRGEADFVIPLHAHLPPFLTEAQQEALELFPMSKVADAARNILDKRKHVLHSVKEISDNFAHLTPFSAGAYGVVARACIRDVKVKRATCQSFKMEEGDIVAPVIVKFAWQLPPPPRTRARSLWALTDNAEWLGSDNATREAFFGRMLNLLVTQHICPNFSSLYNVMQLRNSPTLVNIFREMGKEKEYKAIVKRKGGGMYDTKNVRGASLLIIGMDENVKDMYDFIEKDLKNHPRDIDVLQSMFAQVAAALYCADKQYGFRHNDLHGGNVMVASTDEMFYVYKVGSAYFKVPTYGLAWKIVDYGMSTSDELCEKHDSAAIHALTGLSIDHGGRASNPRTATELYDISRLADTVGYAIEKNRYPSSTKAWLQKHVEKALEKVSETHKQFYVSKILNHIDKTRKEVGALKDRKQQMSKIQRLLQEVGEATRSHGLYKKVLFKLAEPFAASASQVRGADVYDLDKPVRVDKKSFEGLIANEK